MNQPPPHSQTTVPALWNPNAAANWSLLFSPAFGAFLHAKNAESLGRFDEANTNWRWFYAMLVYLVLSLIVLIPSIGALVPNLSDTQWRALGLVPLLAWYFSTAKKQMTFVKETYANSYLRRSWSMPLLVGSAGLIAVFAAGIAGAILWAPSVPLPEVGAPEVIAIARQALENSPTVKNLGVIPPVTITDAREMSYDRSRERRVARAQLTTNLGTETLYYSVEWQDRKKGLFRVDFQQHE